MKSFTTAFVLITLLASCKSKEKKTEIISEVKKEKSFEQMEALEWILGSWTHSTNKSASYENWERENDSTYLGFGYTMVATDTVFAESIILYQQEGGTYFKVTTVGGDDDGDTTLFTKIPSEVNLFVFENKAHDFPQQITYSNPVKDSIHAWISGTIAGKREQVDFYFTRAK